MSSPQVLIVGGGPSGLVLALSLLKNDISVRIIDKNPELRIGQRGAGIMPRAMELFELLGLAEPILDVAFPTPRVKTYELEAGLHYTGTFEMAPHTEPTASFPYLNVLCLGQERLEAILRQELEQKYHCPIELGTELLSFEQDIDGVNVKLSQSGSVASARYDWVVGTDGARGIVRKQLGVSFAGETNNVDKIVVGDIMIQGLDQEFWHMWGDASTTLISLRPTEVPSLFSFILAGKNIDNTSMASDSQGLRDMFVRGTGAGSFVKFGEITWVSNYRPNIRMVDSFGKGRVWLAGDSAHVHSFTGGQGMNTGIQDSFNLAWKIAHIQRGFSPHTLLNSYTEERLPVIAEMLSQTTVLLNQTFVKREKPSVWGRGGSLLQLGVNYRWSSIVLDEQSSHEDDFPEDEDEIDSYGAELGSQLRAGDRAPDAPALVSLKLDENTAATTLRLFDLLSYAHHTVLVFTEEPNRCFAMVRELAAWSPEVVRVVQILRAGSTQCCGPFYAEMAVEDTRGHAYDAYSFTEGCFTVIVRPDGFIGAVVQDSMGLRDYFRGVFCARQK